MLDILSRKVSDDLTFPEDGTLSTFLNPYSYILARRNTKLFEDFDRIYFDGIALSTLYQITGRKLRRRSFDMTSLAPIIFSFAEKNKKSIYFVGTEEKHIKTAVKNFKLVHPEIDVSGMHHGYFSNKESRDECICEIVTLNPNIVIVGMGAILQEKFLIDLRTEGWNGLGFTCGGFLHQTAKSGIEYYPKLINALNLRWAYRIYDEPKLIKRYIFYYPLFVLFFIKDLMSNILFPDQQ